MTPSSTTECGDRYSVIFLTGPPIRVLQVIESLNVEFGGIATACAQLANHLARSGVAVTALTLDRPGPARRRCALDTGIRAVACRPSWPRRLGYCRALPAMLAASPAPDVVHIHGLWRLHFVQAARFAHHLGAPVIVSTHGMLHAAARRQRAAFKRMARWVFQDTIVRQASCLHATAVEEADEIRKLGFTGPIVVIPWGVQPPEPRDADPEPSHASTDRHVVLFLGRFHPTKGVDVLLRAWARVRTRVPASTLVLAGYDDGSYRQRMAALAATLGVSSSVAFEGPVDGPGRERLFARTSLLVLPSPAENFGLVVPEALVRGIPVITTTGTPWSRVIAENCGWWVPAGEDSLAAALADALGRHPDALREMGERGRTFARANFTWERVAASMTALYAWTLGLGPEPPSVRHT
jgi:glycosyltransferase involved in cell wall biosynthesis